MSSSPVAEYDEDEVLDFLSANFVDIVVPPWREEEENPDVKEVVDSFVDVVKDDGGGGGTKDEKLTDNFCVCLYGVPNGGRGDWSTVLVATIGDGDLPVIDNGNGVVGSLVVIVGG